MYYILFVYRFILFTDHRLLCTAGANAVVQCMVGTVIYFKTYPPDKLSKLRAIGTMQNYMHTKLEHYN